MENDLHRKLQPLLANLASSFVVDRLAGDASSRTYYRVHLKGAPWPTAVVMELGKDPLRSDEIDSSKRPVELPFLNIQRYLLGGSIPVPQIYATDMPAGLILLEDLGDALLHTEALAADVPGLLRLYSEALELLLAFQELALRHPCQECIAFQRRFDRDLTLWELQHFLEWGLVARTGKELRPAEAQVVQASFERIALELSSAPTILVHRDFQSRNIMRKEGRLRLIDFQDALLATPVYDLVALVRDSYVILPLDLVDQLVDLYAQRSRLSFGLLKDGDELKRLFYLQTVQRKLKDGGRFHFIDRVKGNPWFLPYVESSFGYAGQALARLDDLADLHAILGAYLPELGYL